MRNPGRRIVSVYRQGTRDRNGDTRLALTGTYGGISVQMTATAKDDLNGQAERAVSNWTLVFPPGTDVLASDRLEVHNYNGGRSLRLAVDGHPHEPQYRSGRPTNLMVRAREVDTL